MGYELERAQMEAARNEAEDEYFKARPQIDCNDRRKVFDAGFERAWAVRQAEIDRLLSKDAGPDPLCEALNSGDGTYKP